MGDHHYNAQAIRPMPDPNALYYYSNSPTRSLLLTNAYSSLSALRSQLETYGDVRALYTDVIPYGRVIVHFFDIKSAEIAFCTILHSYFYQLQRYYYLTRHHNPPLCAFYIILNPHAPPLWRPPFPQYHNQGTLVVFNLDSHVSNHTLHRSFLPYGRIREVRGSPAKSNVKFVEFFDVRDASKALEGMNGKQIGNDINNNKNVVIQFSRPGRWGYTTSTINNSYYYYYDVNFHNNNNNNCYYNYVPRPLLSLPPPPANNLNQASKGEDYSQYEIKESDDGNYVDSRTTLMIKNIANKYSQNDILNLLDKHCIKCNEEIGEGNDQPLSSYDFLYLPIDFGNECNMGYGFVNMTSPQAVLRLHKALHDKCCWGFGSRKICQITYAKYQGMEALKEKLKESKLIIGMEKKIEYTPIMFNPARDGKQMTKPESLWITPESDD